MAITSFDRVSCRILSKDIEEALQAAASKHGIVAKIGRGTFTGGHFTLKVEFSTVGQDGTVNSKEAEDFKSYATLYDLKPEDLGKAITFGPRGTPSPACAPRRHGSPSWRSVRGTARRSASPWTASAAPWSSRSQGVGRCRQACGRRPWTGCPPRWWTPGRASCPSTASSENLTSEGRKNDQDKTLMTMGVKDAGSYEPDKALCSVEESMTGKDAVEAGSSCGGSAPTPAPVGSGTRPWTSG